MKIELDLPDDLTTEAKAIAERRRTTLDSLIENALRKEFYDAPQPGAVAPEPIQASTTASSGKATGDSQTSPASKSRTPKIIVGAIAGLLVVGVAVGLFAPIFLNITKRADESTAKRNAQNIASVCASAIAGGADFEIPGNTSAADSLTKVIEELTSARGVNGSEAVGMHEMFFRVPSMSREEIQAAIEFLEWDEGAGMIVYAP